MKLKNCKICYELFLDSHDDENVCPKCGNNDRENLQKIKQYLIKHPRATILELREHVDISTDTLLRFKREGRI